MQLIRIPWKNELCRNFSLSNNLLLKLTFRTLMSALVIMIKRILEEVLKDENLVEF